MEITFIKKFYFFHKFAVLNVKKIRRNFFKEIVAAISFFYSAKAREVVSYDLVLVRLLTALTNVRLNPADFQQFIMHFFDIQES